MTTLAIKGHKERGREVIEILEMLGGEDRCGLIGNLFNSAYFIESEKIVCESLPSPFVEDIKLFTLEEFIEKYPYKVGDKVNYVKYNDEYSGAYTIQGMRWTGLTIEYLLDSSGFSVLTKDLRPYKEKTMEDKPNLLQQLKDYFDNTPKDIIEKEWHEYDKYNEIGPSVEEYLEYVNNIRNPKFPKTYEKCCEVLNIISGNVLLFNNPNEENDYVYDNEELYNTFDKLKVCRDAYWKIADDWKPDWEDVRYSIYRYKNNEIIKGLDVARCIDRHFLEFPTEEMQEAFLENFKDLIEKCRELL